jgi:hypothetical protein
MVACPIPDFASIRVLSILVWLMRVLSILELSMAVDDSTLVLSMPGRRRHAMHRFQSSPQFRSPVRRDLHLLFT